MGEKYCQAVVRELDAYASENPGAPEVDSIYFGGGTPSLVPAQHVTTFLAACRRHFRVVPECEISLEANPETLTDAKVEEYRRAGVNRISVGAQSFDDRALQTIGRGHTSAQVEESVGLLRAHGIENINLDLMLGLPGQTERTWKADLEWVFQLAPPHVSVYMLDLDEKTPLYHTLRKGQHLVPEDDLVSEWYLRALELFAARGYAQYEISNFSRQGRRSRHNLKYWLREPVLGFGVASHSYDGQMRYANWANLNAYLESIERGGSPIEWRQPLQRTHALAETLFLGLRLNQGVDWNRMNREYDADELAAHEVSLREMSQQGLVEWNDSAVRLTPRGMLLSNEVFQAFV